MIRCVETGRGPKGSIFVCTTPRGDIILRVVKDKAPYLWRISSMLPYLKYRTSMYARTRRHLRTYIGEWLEYVLS